MRRGYTTSAVAAALNVDAKWLDNLLTQNHLAGLVVERQGVPRRFSIEMVESLYVAVGLISRAGAGRAAALKLAEEITSGREAVLAPGVVISFDRTLVRSQLEAQLFDAVEATPRRRRGRPRRGPTDRKRVEDG